MGCKKKPIGSQGRRATYAKRQQREKFNEIFCSEHEGCLFSHGSLGFLGQFAMPKALRTRPRPCWPAGCDFYSSAISTHFLCSPVA